MGCTASKLDNEDTVRRCKERRRLMKEIVFSRHHLAAAHSDYCHSLRLTGSSLASFAAGEPLSVSDQSPAILLRDPSSLSRSSTIPFPPRATSPSPQPPPPPPSQPRGYSTARSPTISSSKLPHILSASSISSFQNAKQQQQQHNRRRHKPPKLPHILSESSPSSTPRSLNSSFFPPYEANATYSRTPSQASSVWNWENFYPPSPPDSEFFNRQKDDGDTKNPFSKSNHHDHHLDREGETEEEEDEEEGEETEREEVHCSEWGDRDHYSTTSSSDEDDEDGDRESRSEIGTRSNFGSSVKESFAPPPN